VNDLVAAQVSLPADPTSFHRDTAAAAEATSLGAPPHARTFKGCRLASSPAPLPPMLS